jgi:hypothetical protein
MTLQRFQGIVLKLGNQMFVRHYHWLNYPNDPQLLGIQFPSGAARSAGRRHKRERSCECGKCVKCKHREYMKNTRVPVADGMGRIVDELKALGFEWNAGLKTWTIERNDA